MNRWQGWAQRLRTRHSRIDAWRAPGAMVLLRGQGASAQARHIHAGTSLHLHTHLVVSPRLSVSMRPAMARPMILRTTAPVDGTTRQAHDGAGHAMTLGTRSNRHEAPVGHLAAPAFVPAFRHPALGQSSRAGPEPIRLSVRRGEGASPIARHAGEIAQRLRRGAIREEVRPATQAAVLALPQRAAAQPAGAGGDSVEVSALWRTRLDEARAVQSAPALNVEALTGMVIQQIDRRLVAYRERMGRA